METKEIIYLIGFALVLRAVVRIYFKYKKDKTGNQDQEES
jgi:hypothetical protein